MLLNFIFEKEKRREGREEERKTRREEGKLEGRKKIHTTHIYLPGMVARSNEVDYTKAQS